MKDPTAAEQYLHHRWDWERLVMLAAEGEFVQPAKDNLYALLSNLWRRMKPAERHEVAVECVATYRS